MHDTHSQCLYRVSGYYHKTYCIILYTIFKSLSFTGKKRRQWSRYSSPSRLFLQPRGVSVALGSYGRGIETKPRGDVSTTENWWNITTWGFKNCFIPITATIIICIIIIIAEVTFAAITLILFTDGRQDQLGSHLATSRANRTPINFTTRLSNNFGRTIRSHPSTGNRTLSKSNYWLF